MEKMLKSKKAIIFFEAPAFIIFTLILFIPIVHDIYLSFCDYDALSPAKFSGLKNYAALLQDRVFIGAVKNTIFFMLFSLVSQQAAGLSLAAVLSNLKYGRNILKNIYYLPNVLSSAALALLFSFLLKPQIGINAVLAVFGIKGPNWLMTVSGFPSLTNWVIGFVALWIYVGTTMMLYMAGIAGIDQSLMEAAYIDGASKTQTFFRITMPLLKPMAKTTISLTCIGSLKFFDLIYNMTQGGPNNKTQTIATWLYQQGFKFFKYGYASAMSVVLLILCLVTTFIVNKSVNVKDFEN